jgi:protein-S-isoprenylcysteine O-methyltransferase Ste14
MLSWVLVSANLLFLVYYVLSVLLIVVRIPREERMMLEEFGEEYRIYMKRTGRLLPCFRQENGEEE